MADRWLRAAGVFDGARLRGPTALRIAEGIVVEIAPAETAPDEADQIDAILSPGFVDLQVNGGGGVLLNTTPTPEGIATIITAHRGFGTTALLPTVITDAPEVLAAAVDAVLAAHPMPGLLGLHIEGPHISTARRGTHDARFIRPLDDITMAHVARLRSAGLAVMITLAPEAATPAQVAELTALGAVVSIGHSDAKSDEVRALIEAGAQAATHLFNAMSPIGHREPGVAGAILNSEAYASLIADGIHVADEMLGLALRARPVPDRCFLVSDAMPSVGGPDRFALYGQEITLADGRLINADGKLAGAHLTQSAGVARLVAKVGVSPEEALCMAITTPAKLIRSPNLADILGQRLDDLICLSEGLQFSRYLGKES